MKPQHTRFSTSRSILHRILSIAMMGMPSTVVLSAVFLPLIATPAAQAVPLPKDWCGRIWGVVNSNSTINWDNPTNGASNPAATAPPPNIAAIPALPGADYTTLGIHARSGTLYALDRSNHTLAQYSMSTGGTWTTTVLPQIPNIQVGLIPGTNTGYTTAQTNATNFNKMTVTSDKLIIASSDSLKVYTYKGLTSKKSFQL